MQDDKINFKIWLNAMRLRTLPLALASIAMGAFLAASNVGFDWSICILSLLTTTALQILSNFANDYGDHMNGADNEHRVGPSRMVQEGSVSPKKMKRAMVIMSIISFVLGIALLVQSLSINYLFLIFILLGVLSIYAAIKYTSGSNPYGYKGLGDIFVFLFFGWVGVVGSYYLYMQSIDWLIFLPATSCSVFAVAVLNLNNMRDISSDVKAGKITMPVRFGKKWAIKYHISLLLIGIVCAVLYVWLKEQSYFQLLFLLVLPLLYKNGYAVVHNKISAELDPFLKQMALTSLLFVLLFGIGQLIVQ